MVGGAVSFASEGQRLSRTSRDSLRAVAVEDQTAASEEAHGVAGADADVGRCRNKANRRLLFLQQTLPIWLPARRPFSLEGHTGFDYCRQSNHQTTPTSRRSVSASATAIVSAIGIG